NAPRLPPRGIRFVLSRLRTCPAQGLFHARTHGSAPPSRPNSTSPLLFRSRSRIAMLGFRRDADSSSSRSLISTFCKSHLGIPSTRANHMNSNFSVTRIACCFLFAAALILSITLLQEKASLRAPATDLTSLAPTPPMGWNSWDAYGEAVTEADLRAS